LRVTILGTRGNVESSAPGYSKHSGILVDGVILLDAGETEYLRHRPKYVFITHLHPDHVAIGPDDVPRETVIYAPESTPALPMIRVISEAVRVDHYTITPIPTVHSQRVKSVAYLVERSQTRFLYSSDLVRIKRGFSRLLKGLDFVITEGSFMRSGGLVRKDAKTGAPVGHNGIPDLVRFFGRFTKRIVVTHYGTWFYKDIPRSLRWIQSLGNGVRVMAAHDGMSVA
jgi:ribonuclease BN (tRNA processing enzyme)